MAHIFYYLLSFYKFYGQQQIIIWSDLKRFSRRKVNCTRCNTQIILWNSFFWVPKLYFFSHLMRTRYLLKQFRTSGYKWSCLSPLVLSLSVPSWPEFMLPFLCFHVLASPTISAILINADLTLLGNLKFRFKEFCKKSLLPEIWLRRETIKGWNKWDKWPVLLCFFLF